ncbi:MAG: HAD family hydrolase, partial [Paramuribaculum sp.]|nr:HAD family hydrolase [Paramuribaculum sp.]
ADTAVAVANALPEVQAAATTIIPTNDTNAVAHYLAATLTP